jgi:hypothetical protein
MHFLEIEYYGVCITVCQTICFNLDCKILTTFCEDLHLERQSLVHVRSETCFKKKCKKNEAQTSRQVVDGRLASRLRGYHPVCT